MCLLFGDVNADNEVQMARCDKAALGDAQEVKVKTEFYENGVNVFLIGTTKCGKLNNLL